MKLINLVPLKEGAFGMSAEDLAATYSLERLQSIRDEIMGDMEQEAEPEGGHIADMYADQLQGIDDAIALKRPTKDVPYDVAIGKMTQDEYDEYMSTVKPDRASFEKSSKFKKAGERSGFDMRGLNEATEKSWNAIDVSRKAEKEIDNKEWNERTTKKLDMLKALNKSGKFKKDWGEDKLQGWVDQNYSWEKLARQFKIKENKMAKKSLTERFQQLAGIKPLYEIEGRKADHTSFKFDNYNNDGDIPLPTAGQWEDGTEMTEDELEAYYDKMGDSTMHSIMHDNLGEAKGYEGDSPMPFRSNPDANDQWSKDQLAQMNQRSGYELDGKEVDKGTIELDGTENIERWGMDDALPDIFISYAEFTDGTELTDDQMYRLLDKYDELVQDTYYEGANMEEGEADLEDYRLEPEDMDNPDEDLVIIGSGYLDIKSNFGERPSQTNGEYAEIGQKVVDQLHNGDKEAALDYIYSQINEGSCGYGPDGVPGDTPGGTKGMPADKRTMTMREGSNKFDYKKWIIENKHGR
jgi:hypothetical protein